MDRPNIGDRRQITIGNSLRDAVIVEIIGVDGSGLGGHLEVYDVEGYGVTQPYYIPNGNITGVLSGARRNMSRMPLEYVYKRAKDFDWCGYQEDTTKQKKIVNAFVLGFAECKKQGKGLYIFSKTKGSGKTMLACCVANEIIQRNDISVKFMTTLDYLELCKRNSDSAIEDLRSIRECSLLILDDIGTESNKDWVNDMLYRLINYRDSAFLPTIYTSNTEITDLDLDSRIINRVESHSIPVCMPEQSIRREKARKETGKFLEQIFSREQEDIFKNAP